MKNLLFILLLCSSITYGQTYYMSPTGNDSYAGTLAAPFKTFGKFQTVATAGATLYVRGGTYRSTAGAAAGTHFTIENLTGSAGNMISILAYPGEQPIFNLDNITPTNNDPTILAIENCTYIHIKGLRFTGLAQRSNGAGVSRGIEYTDVTHSLFELIELDHIGGYGNILSSGTNDNRWLKCDAHHMDDRYTPGLPTSGGAWSNANGFQCTGSSNATRDTFELCRAWWISDDGFDLYGVSGTFVFKNCWAFWNGYEPGTFTERGDGDGFKLGGGSAGNPAAVTRVVTGCKSFGNKEHGYNRNTANTRFTLYNNTASHNGQKGFIFDNLGVACTAKNNLSYGNGTNIVGTDITGDHNSWNSMSVSNSDFQSVSYSGADGPRQADGSMPDIAYMKLQAGSPLINAGVDVGLPFNSTAPEIGADEFSSANPPQLFMYANLPIKAPTNSVTLSAGLHFGTGTSPFTYLWEQTSGPNTASLSSPTSLSTNASNLIPGTYVFKLTVTDANFLTGVGYLTQIVQPGANPTNFKIVAAVSTPTGINVSWTATLGTTSQKFYLQRRTFRSFSTIHSTIASSAGKYVDKPESGTYTYRVVAIETDGTQIYSPTSTVTYKKKASASLKP